MSDSSDAWWWVVPCTVIGFGIALTTMIVGVLLQEAAGLKGGTFAWIAIGIWTVGATMFGIGLIGNWLSGHDESSASS